MKLYIFLVNTGSMLTFDTELAIQSVTELKMAIQKHHRISIHHQVLVVNGGESMAPERRVCSYCAGTDTNPIFLFSKELILRDKSPAVPRVVFPAETEIENRVEETLLMPPVFHTVAMRAQLALDMQEAAEQLSEYCKDLVHDEHLQHQGWASIMANLDDCLQAYSRLLAAFSRAYRLFCKDKNTILVQLQGLGSAVSLMAQIPLLECFTAATAQTSTKEKAQTTRTVLEQQEKHDAQITPSKSPIRVTEFMGAKILSKSSDFVIPEKTFSPCCAGSTPSRQLGGGKRFQEECLHPNVRKGSKRDKDNHVDKVVKLKDNKDVDGFTAGIEDSDVEGHNNRKDEHRVMQHQGDDLLEQGVEGHGVLLRKTTEGVQGSSVQDVILTDVKKTLNKLTMSGLSSQESNTRKASEAKAFSVSLLDWLNVQDRPNDVEALVKECLHTVNTLEPKMVEPFLHECQEVYSNIDKSAMKSIRGLEERLFALDQVLASCTRLLAEQRELAQGFLANQKRAENLNDPSVLPDLCVSHANQLLLMMGNHKRLCESRQTCLMAKQQLSDNLHIRFRWCYLMMHHLDQHGERLAMLWHLLRSLKGRLWIASEFSNAPRLYCLAVSETARRRAFSKRYTKWAEALVKDGKHVYDVEKAKRQSFSRLFGKYFLCDRLFKGLQSWPSSSFCTRSPRKFDEDLPLVTEADLLFLQHHCPPEVLPYIRIPSMLDIDVPTSPQHVLPDVGVASTGVDSQLDIRDERPASSSSSPLSDQTEVSSLSYPGPNSNEPATQTLTVPAFNHSAVHHHLLWHHSPPGGGDGGDTAHGTLLSPCEPPDLQEADGLSLEFEKLPREGLEQPGPDNELEGTVGMAVLEEPPCPTGPDTLQSMKIAAQGVDSLVECGSLEFVSAMNELSSVCSPGLPGLSDPQSPELMESLYTSVINAIGSRRLHDSLNEAMALRQQLSLQQQSLSGVQVACHLLRATLCKLREQTSCQSQELMSLITSTGQTLSHVQDELQMAAVRGARENDEHLMRLQEEQSRSDLEQQLQGLRAEVELVTGQVAALQVAVVAKENEIESLSAQLSQAKVTGDEQARHVTELEEEVERNTLAASEERLSFQESHARMKAHLEQLDAELLKRGEAALVLDRRVQELKEQNCVLQLELAAQSGEAEEQRRALDNFREEQEQRMHEEIKLLDADHQKLTQDFQQKLDLQVAETDGMRKMLMEVSEELRTCKVDLEEQYRERSTLQDILAGCRKKSEEERQQARQENETLQNEIETLSMREKELMQQLECLKGHEEDASKREAELQMKIQGLCEAANQRQADVAQLQEDLLQQNRAKENLDQEMEKALTTVESEQRAAMILLQEEIDKEKNANEFLRGCLEKDKSEKESLTRDNDQEKREKEELKMLLHQEKSKCEDLMEKLEQVRHDKEALEAAASHEKGEKEHMRRELEQEQKKNNALAYDLQQEKSDKDKLRMEFEHKQLDLQRSVIEHMKSKDAEYEEAVSMSLERQTAEGLPALPQLGPEVPTEGGSTLSGLEALGGVGQQALDPQLQTMVDWMKRDKEVALINLRTQLEAHYQTCVNKALMRQQQQTVGLRQQLLVLQAQQLQDRDLIQSLSADRAALLSEKKQLEGQLLQTSGLGLAVAAAQAHSGQDSPELGCSDDGASPAFEGTDGGEAGQVMVDKVLPDRESSDEQKTTGSSEVGQKKMQPKAEGSGPTEKLMSQSLSAASHHHEKISIRDFLVGDLVLIVLVERYDNYLLFTVGPTLFFLHTECLEALGLRSVPGEPRKSCVLGKLVEKEYCQAKKVQNRFNVPLGTKFYRVKAVRWGHSV